MRWHQPLVRIVLYILNGCGVQHLNVPFVFSGNSLGWCVVWQLFLSKFKFLRELIGDTGSQQGDSENAEPEAEQDALLLTPQRNRQKPARQRKGPAEEAS